MQGGDVGRIFVSADWSQLETWLTAHFSGDPTMQAELEAQLSGGHKIHALNAGLIYGIDPGEAKTHMVNLQGQERPAYDGGKRSGHAFNYGMQDNKMAKTFWIKRDFAREILAKLAAKYERVVSWREGLSNEVFGVFEYQCGRCGYVQLGAGGKCPTCSNGRRKVPLRYVGVAEPPAKCLYTPFARRRIYLGRRNDGANAVASQLPQSCGASMWYRTLLRLHGWDPYTDELWPTPPGCTIFSPRLSTYGELYAPMDTFVATGTYDSFLVETTSEKAESVLEWLLWTMEQPWSELSNKQFPAEGSVGKNWGKATHDNPSGLEDIDYKPFSARRS